MVIAFGSDHGGYELKLIILDHLKQKGIETIDCGSNSTLACDYSDYAQKACALVNDGTADTAILICGTGVGMSVSANKINGIRCALCGDVFTAKATRSHNDANVLAIGARAIGRGHALEIVDAYINTPFSKEERHERRIQKIMDMENK
jgi:ribose 5-phosphate isomerase B